MSRANEFHRRNAIPIPNQLPVMKREKVDELYNEVRDKTTSHNIGAEATKINNIDGNCFN